jgi:dTDP-glucose 4,6-dehydratase
VYGDGRNIRDWIYVQDNCAAIDFVSQNGTPGEIYNIAAKNEKENLEIVDQILHLLKKPRALIRFVQDRPAHDRRYSLDVTKMTVLGWVSTAPFKEALANTIDWYQKNEWWWKPLKQ